VQILETDAWLMGRPLSMEAQLARRHQLAGVLCMMTAPLQGNKQGPLPPSPLALVHVLTSMLLLGL
jgi:hypothetical protein